MKSSALILLVSVALGAPHALGGQEPLPPVPQSLSLRDAVDRAERALAGVSAGLSQRIRAKLPLELDEALRRELQQRFLEQIQKYDPFRQGYGATLIFRPLAAADFLDMLYDSVEGRKV